MTKRGEGARALGAAYMSALMGGLFGAVLMAVVLPIVRPLVLQIGSPQLLGLAVIGISMVSSLSGGTPLRGLTMACFGITMAMVGSDPQTGSFRWTMGSLYLMDGLPLVPVTLGVFALPELCDLLISRRSISSEHAGGNNWRGLWQGSKDCISHWWLVTRCSWIGSVIGAIPGISTAVIDWVSYAHAMKTEPGARESFGKGDVRGVIAAESATCSREGGALVPTIVFGVPGSAGMALLLGAFLMHGLVPGPDMLTTNLSVTYAMVWSIAVANILGSGLCFLFSSQIAKIASLRYTLFLPVVLSLIYLGAFEGHRSWGDFYALLIFGILGWVMKHMQWPRPPLVLGFILGQMLERYMFISIQRYGASWLVNPSVLILFSVAALSLSAPLIQNIRQHGGWATTLVSYHRPVFRAVHLFPLFLIGTMLVLMTQMAQWSSVARIVPTVVLTGALLFCFASVANSVFGDVPATESNLGNSEKEPRASHFDIAGNLQDLSVKTIVVRGLIFFGWLVAFIVSMAAIGLIPTVPIFIIALMRIEGREPWRIIIPMAIVMTGFILFVFNYLLAIPWPGSYLGDVCGWCKTYIPST
jgi:TctA family transporter